MYIVILLRLLHAVKLRNEIDARTFKAQLIMGVRRCLDSSSTPKL